MQKSGLSVVFGLILLGFVGFISAQYYGGYGGSSFSDFLNNTDQSLIFLGVLFVIFCAGIYFSLSRSVFKENNTIAGIISLSVSFLLIWWINKSGIDYYSGVFPFLPDLQGFIYSISSGVFFVIILGAILWAFIGKTVMPLILFGGAMILFGWIAPYGSGLIGMGIAIIAFAFIVPWVISWMHKPRVDAWGRPYYGAMRP